MKVLVVDDEQDIQFLFQQQFRRKSGKILLNLHLPFQANRLWVTWIPMAIRAVLILSDINMPGMSGLELLQRIKQHHYQPEPVVMMITAYGDAENYKQAMSLGANDFLTKPLDFSLLKEKLKTI